MSSVFAGLSFAQLLLVAIVACLAAVIGGVAGYGTGALMPLVLVPIIAISSLLTNSGRALAFRKVFDRRRAAIVLAASLPTCMLGAYGYTRLNNKGALIVIGTMLMASVPLRRFLRRRDMKVGDRGLALGAAGYGVVIGGSTGAGVILLSLLMASGLEGAAVIATDAAITVALGIVRAGVFGIAGVLGAQVLALALLIGGIALPSAFLAKALIDRMPIRLHTAMLDAVVVSGGAVLIYGALRA